MSKVSGFFSKDMISYNFFFTHIILKQCVSDLKLHLKIKFNF